MMGDPFSFVAAPEFDALRRLLQPQWQIAPKELALGVPSQKPLVTQLGRLK